MRVLAIRGRNLASLEGPFEVDLAAGALGRSGLFAITGSTGSGKTTLLDALCLALYDTTPRLLGRGGEEIGSAAAPAELRIKASDVRALLRRGCGEAEAEVDFVGADGGRYRARWSVRRARGRATGRLQAQTLDLFDLGAADPEQPLTRTKSEALDAIAMRVGLTFDQFRRSVLLAQGDFAAFLHADPSERAELLERMTGTELFGRLSRAAHDRARSASRDVEDLERRRDAFSVLSTDERAAQEQALSAARRAAQETANRLRRLDDLAAARTRVAQAQVLLGAAQDAARRAEELRGAAEPRRSELRSLEAVQPLRPVFEREREVRRRVAVTAAAAKSATATAAATQAALAAAAQAATAARARLERGRITRALTAGRAEADALARLAPLEQCGRKAEASLVAAARAADAAREQLAAGVTEFGASGEAQRDAERALAAAERWTATGVTAERVSTDVAQVAAELDAIAGDRELAAARRIEWTARATQADESLRAVEAALGLAARRADLVAGTPCPLCGAVEHPFAEHEPAESARAAAADVAARAASERDAARSAVETCDARSAVLVERRQGLEREMARAATERADALGEWCSVVGESGTDAATPDAVPDVAAATARLASARGQVGELGRLRAERDAADGVERAAQATQRAATKATEEARLAAADARALRERYAEGVVIASDAAPEATSIDDACAEVDAATLAVTAAAQELASATERAETERVRMEERGAEAARAALEAEERTDELHRAIAAAGREVAATEALLREPEARLAELRTELSALDAAVSETTVVCRERAAALAARQAELPAAPSEERLAALWADAELAAQERAALGEASLAHTALVERVAGAMRADDDARDAVAALEGEIAEHRSRAAVWLDLRELIGSADGKKFRQFAQGLTLDVLLRETNHQLRDLAPRYALERVPGADLALQVVDRDLGDEIRSVRSLSGGESFLVSLALALGLASMASRRSPVDSLFIDEGFGTLDPQSLDVALAALESLQATGRQVGVISHVPGLAEQIGVAIHVRMHGGGRSSVEVHESAGSVAPS